MEATLNIVWALLAGLGISLWLRSSFPQSPRKAGRRLKAESVALACLLCLLFVVISVSDDLYLPNMACDEAAKLRKVHLCAGCGHSVVPHYVFHLGLPVRIPLDVELASLELMRPQIVSVCTAVLGSSLLDRAPPQLIPQS